MLSTEELLIAFDELESIIVVTDTDGKIRYVNNSFVKKYGYTKEEAYGGNPNVLNSGHHSKEFYSTLWDTINKGDTWEGTFLNKAKNGKLIWENAKISPIHKEGKLSGFIAVKEDITYKKELEEQFYKEKYLLEELFDNAPVGVAIFQPIIEDQKVIDLLVLKANPIAAHLVGRLGIVGLPFSEFMPDFLSLISNKSEFLTEKMNFESFFEGLQKYINLRTFPLGNERMGIFFYDVTDYNESLRALKESEERYFSLVEDAPTMIRRFNTSGIISYVNSFYGKYFSEDPLKVVGTSIYKHIPVDRKEQFVKNLQCLSFKKPQIEYQQKIKMPNGDYRWQKWIDRALFNDKGEIYEYQSIGMDFSKLKKTEEALEKQKNKSDAIINNSAVAVAVLDQTYKIILVNDKLVDMFGYDSQHELLGLSIIDIEEKEDHLISEEILNKIYSLEEEFANLQKRYVKKDRSVFWGDLYIAPIRYSGKVVVETVAIIADVTERKEIDEELKRHEQELQKLNHTKDKLFSVIAHDIRNPFSTILGFSSLLKKNLDSYSKYEIKDFVSKILEASEQTFKLLEDLLTWAKSQLGQLKVNKKLFSPREQVDSSFRSLQAIADGKNVLMVNQVNANHQMVSDIEMFKFVIRNLVHNAIKFSHPNSQVICGSYINVEQKLVIFVKDEGIGIRKEKQAYLFNLGEFLTTAGTSAEKGTGLGLSLAKQMVEQNDGVIELESEVNKGTEFRLIFSTDNII